MKTALDFSEIDAGMLAEVGGKAANLGELTRAGLPVPPGWVLTTDAYRQVAQGLRVEGEGLAERARRHLMEAPVPDAVHEAIVRAYEALGDDVPVAVRSSATAEDLPFASFAGQQDTFLNVVGAQEVVQAVRRCWASLWTDRAVAYRESNGIDHAAVRLAVVVQVMVDARVAGVMFTANPVTGRRRESVIDASPGLGEAVVSGAVNPDRFRVHDGRILERHAGDKRLAIRSLPGGGTERVETDGQGLCLIDGEVRELAALGARVEAHYGAPQDTEWAIDHDGTLWLTQARPITTLYPLPEHARPGLRVYFSVNVVQGVMGPLTPMGQSAFRVISAGGAGLAGHRPADLLGGAGFVTVSGERLWLDLTTAVRSRPGRAILPRVLTLGEARAVGVMERLFEDPRLTPAHTSMRPFLRGLVRFAGNLRLPRRILTALTRPDQAVAATVRLGEALDGRLRVPASATPEQRLDHAERVLAGTFPLIISIMPTVITGYGLFALASRLSGVPVPEMSDVLRSLPHNPTTEMDLECGSCPPASSRSRSGSCPCRSWSPAIARAGSRRSLSARSPRSSAGTVTAASPRSTWACRDGRRSPATSSACWPTTCAWTRSCPPPSSSPTGRGRPARPWRTWRPGPGAGAGGGPPWCASGSDARAGTPGCASCPSSTWSRRLRRSGAACSWWGSTWWAWACWTRRRMCSSWT